MKFETRGQEIWRRETRRDMPLTLAYILIGLACHDVPRPLRKMLVLSGRKFVSAAVCHAAGSVLRPLNHGLHRGAKSYPVRAATLTLTSYFSFKLPGAHVWAIPVSLSGKEWINALISTLLTPSAPVIKKEREFTFWSRICNFLTAEF